MILEPEIVGGKPNYDRIGCKVCLGLRRVLCRRCMGEGQAKFNSLEDMVCPLCNGGGRMECINCPPPRNLERR